MSKPFVLGEANLPKGFPPPGPVGQILIKDYPVYRLARVTSGKSGVEGGPSRMFGPLYNHIKRNEIAMTSPVEIGYDRNAGESREADATSGDRRLSESMAFLYRDPAWGNLGIDPSDPRIVVEEVPAMTVLSIGVRGDYTDDQFIAAIGKLREWISANPGCVRVTGSPRYLAYNSPFVPRFMKFGEVQIPVQREESSPGPSATQYNDTR